jgi:hypothetical protein
MGGTPPPPVQPPSDKMPLAKRPVFWIALTVLIFIGVTAAIAGGGSKTSTSDTKTSDSTKITQPESSTATSESPAAKAPPSPKDPAGLWLSTPVPVPPGPSGQLAVVSMSAPVGDFGMKSMTLLVRNNTNKALAVDGTDLYVTARDSAGALVATASGLPGGFEPLVLQPGEWGFGDVHFISGIPAGSKLEATAKGTPEASVYGTQFKITRATVRPRSGGGVSIDAVVQNPGLDTPSVVGANVGCFAADGTPLRTWSSTLHGTIPPGGTTEDLIEDYSACPIVALGIEGI